MTIVIVYIVEDKKDDMFCKLFALTFQDITQKWFIQLPPKRVKDFNSLAKKFINN